MSVLFESCSITPRTIDVQRAGPAWHGTGLCQARPDGVRADMARRAHWVMPLRTTGLAFDLGTALWVVFRAVLAYKA